MIPATSSAPSTGGTNWVAAQMYRLRRLDSRVGKIDHAPDTVDQYLQENHHHTGVDGSPQHRVRSSPSGGGWIAG